MNLADIYSYIDSKKRAVGGLLENPGGTIDKYVSQFREDNRDRINLMANAYPMAGDKTVLNSPHQLDQFRKQLADEGANMGMTGTMKITPEIRAQRMADMGMERGWYRGGPKIVDGKKTGDWYTPFEGDAKDYAARTINSDVREYAVPAKGILKPNI